MQMFIQITAKAFPQELSDSAQALLIPTVDAVGTQAITLSEAVSSKKKKTQNKTQI